MNLNEGQESSAYIQGTEDLTGFVPYSEMFVRKDNLFFLTIPETKEILSANFTGLAKVPVKPGTIHAIRLTGMGIEQINIAIVGDFYSKNEYVESLPILGNTFSQNVNGMTALEKDFAVPSGVDSMILNVRLTSAKAEEMRPGVKVVIEELAIKEKCKIKTPAAEISGKNLLSARDFTNCSLGEFAGIHKGNGKDAKHWSDVDAQIVEFDGRKCLKIERTPQNYIYPFLTSKPFPLDPQNYFIKVTVTARGKGEFRIGLWWTRKNFDRDYQNRVKCVLSDEWKTFTEVRACLSPLVTCADLSFTSSGDAVIYIKNVSMEFIDPENKQGNF
ncbi:MAG: hypothetical protein WCT39_04505 [Candidatus Margulisiibacteriota bacterium]